MEQGTSRKHHYAVPQILEHCVLLHLSKRTYWTRKGQKDVYSGFPPVYQERFKRPGFFHTMVKRTGSREAVKDLFKQYLKMER